MANEVVWYSSDEVGAPTLNNVAGSMINVLDACLIDGFNAKGVTSIAVAGGVATATISAHGYLTDRIVEFSGATPTALNGRKRVTVTGSNTVTFPAPGVADQTATGTITCKRPGLGWAKQFSGAGKAIYKRTDVTATTMMLRVDDTQTGVASATYARAIMVEGATDIDTVTDPVPTAVQTAGGFFWQKGPNTSTGKAWIIVGDSKTMYFMSEDTTYTEATYQGLCLKHFGDLNPLRAGDAYLCTISGETSQTGGSPLMTVGTYGSSGGINRFRVARAFDNMSRGTALQTLFYASAPPGQLTASAGPAYPSPVDNGIVLIRDLLVRESSTAFTDPIRGRLRGIAAPLGQLGSRLHRTVLENVSGFSGKMLCVSVLSTSDRGAIFFDITGPWD